MFPCYHVCVQTPPGASDAYIETLPSNPGQTRMTFVPPLPVGHSEAVRIMKLANVQTGGTLFLRAV